MTTMMEPENHYTLADLLGHWEHGELTLEEVLARWPHDESTPREELLRDLLRMLLTQGRRIAALEQQVAAMR